MAKTSDAVAVPNQLPAGGVCDMLLVPGRTRSAASEQCESCGHETDYHDSLGCWFALEGSGRDVFCACEQS